MREKRPASVTFILVTLLLDTLGIGLVIPVMPRLVGNFVGGDIAAASRYYGVLIAVYAAMQFVFAPVLGGLSDRFGRRRVILSSLLGAGARLCTPRVRTQSVVVLRRARRLRDHRGELLGGHGLHRRHHPSGEARGRALVWWGAAFGLGFILGPALGGLLGGVSLKLPFLLAASLNLLNFFYGLLVLPESLKPENRRAFSFARANPFAALRNLGRHPVLLGLTATLTCSFLAQQILQCVWALYTQGVSRGPRWMSVCRSRSSAWPAPSCRAASSARSCRASASGACSF